MPGESVPEAAAVVGDAAPPGVEFVVRVAGGDPAVAEAGGHVRRLGVDCRDDEGRERLLDAVGEGACVDSGEVGAS